MERWHPVRAGAVGPAQSRWSNRGTTTPGASSGKNGVTARRDGQLHESEIAMADESKNTKGGAPAGAAATRPEYDVNGSLVGWLLSQIQGAVKVEGIFKGGFAAGVQAERARLKPEFEKLEGRLAQAEREIAALTAPGKAEATVVQVGAPSAEEGDGA